MKGIVDIDVGSVIAGKYELVKLLGKGAMGEVWLATHNSLGGEFAIKLVETTDDIEAETAAGRFQLEAQIAAKLSRKTRHIVSVSDHGEEGGRAYLVMELLEGESLESKVKRVGVLDVPEVAAIVMQVARALGLAHDDGIFHRDLKPANVFLTRDEDGRLLVKLLDFGIARTKKPFRTRSPFATSKDMVLGTPSYMSPEQARGLDSLDYRCDLWALAVVAYEALTKKIPFEGETVEDIFLSICTFRVVPARTRRAELPPVLDEFFGRAFAPKIEERYNTASELSAAFEDLVQTEALEAVLGMPLRETSMRRLAATSPSDPEIAAPVPPGATARGSNPFLEAEPPNKSADPVPVWGEAESTGKRRTGGVVYALAGVMVAVALVVFILVAFRPPKSTPASTSPPDEPAKTVASAASGPVPSASGSIAPTSIEIVDAPASQRPMSHAPTSAPAPGKSHSRPSTASQGNAKASPGAPPAPPNGATAASTTPAPATSKKGDKGDVF